MKRVKSKDLEVLIANYYYMFLDPDREPINDILERKGKIQIDIDSVYINVHNINGKDFDAEKQRIDEFMRWIEQTTCGNLKVTYYDRFEIHIANSYEVAEVN